MPTLLSDVIKEVISRSVTLEVVAELPERESVSEAILSLAPDIVFIGLLQGEADTVGSNLLRLAPRAKVIAISSNGRNAYVYEMLAHRDALLEFTPAMLVQAVLGSRPS
jgi:DNA-binding NarL/FixJ family response regulator